MYFILYMCVLLCSSFVCISAYANEYFKTTIMKSNFKRIQIAGVPSSQALPGLLITTPPSVCVPDVIGVLAVWFQKKKTVWRHNNPPRVCISAVLGTLACGSQANKKKVFCSISRVFNYMCVRLPFVPWSIAGVPSSQELPGYLTTAYHLCAFLLYLAR